MRLQMWKGKHCYLVLSLNSCSVQMAATREAVPSPMDLPDKLSARTRPVRLS